MPFETRYTRIPYTAAAGSDIQLDKQRGLVWVFCGGGDNYHYPPYGPETHDGPNFFKIRMSDGMVLLYGRGPLVSWDYEDVNFGGDMSVNFEVWSFAVAPSSGNLYVALFNPSTNQGRIDCLSPNDLSLLFSSPLITGVARTPYWLVLVEPYVYYWSQAATGTPPMTFTITRLPLSLAQVDWTATTFAGSKPPSTEMPHPHLAVDSAGQTWTGCFKSLSKISPAGVVTTYDLTASLNSRGSIRALGYDAPTNTLGMYVTLQRGAGTSAPYTTIVKVNCATGAVTATYTEPAGMQFDYQTFPRVWEHIYDGRVVLRLYFPAVYNPPPNQSAVVDFDLRKMAVSRIYPLVPTWALDDTPVEEYYGDSPLNVAQNCDLMLPDLSVRTLWIYNDWHGWIYPDGEYPLGSYGVWRWLLGDCSTYIKFRDDDWGYDRLYLDRERGHLWHASVETDDAPYFAKVRTSDGHLLLNQQVPGLPQEVRWYIYYTALSEVTGNMYFNDDSGEAGRVLCVSGTSLNLLHTSPYLPSNLGGLWVRGQYVFVIDRDNYSAPPNQGLRERLSRLPLDLSRIDWTVQLYDVQLGSGLKPFVFGQGHCTVDNEGNVWIVRRTELYRVDPQGALQVYSIAASLPSTAYMTVCGLDAEMNRLIMLIQHQPSGAAEGLARFDLTTRTFAGYQSNALWDARQSYPANWTRLPQGKVWLRLRNRSLPFKTPPHGDMAEVDTRTFQVVRQFNLTSDWCIQDLPEDNYPLERAVQTMGYLWDDCACCLWLYNGDRTIYPD